MIATRPMPVEPVQKTRAEIDKPLKGDSGRSFFDSNLFAAVILVVIILAVFFKTVFLGESISKLGLLNQADTLVNSSVKSVERFCVYDPSIYELAIPIQMVIERIWTSGNLPLWNPYNGCGYPMVGDIQSFVFSPIRFLFSASRAYLYNLSLVLQVVFGAICMFALARKLFISRISSVMAALSFTFCPYLLRNLELPSYNYLFPAVFLTFAWLAENPSIVRSILTGLVCGIVVVSMHPECTLFSISFGSLLFLLLIASKNSTGGVLEKRQVLVSAATSLLIAGTVAFCFSAPAIFPFAEYMTNSQCYKTADFKSDYYSINALALLLNFIYPAFGVLSPYTGVVAMAMVPVALIWQTRIVRCLALTVSIAFIMVTCLDTVSATLHTNVLGWLVPVYSLPVLIMGLSLLAGCGLDQLFSGASENLQKKLLVLVAAVLTMGLVPAVLVLLKTTSFYGLVKGRYVPGIGAYMDIDVSMLWLNTIALAGVLAVIFALKSGSSRRRLATAAILLVGLNCASQARTVSMALPALPKVKFQTMEPIRFLQEKNERTISTGVHLFLANTNAVFGIRDLRLSDALFPQRYLDFIDAAGAEKHGFFLYCYHNPLKKLLDLASIKYVMTQFPLKSADQPPPAMQVIPELSRLDPVCFKDGVRLEEAWMSYVPEESVAFARLKMKVHKVATHRYTIQPVLLNFSGRQLWSGDKQSLLGDAENKHMQTLEFAYPIPVSAPPGSLVKPSVRVTDRHDEKIRPAHSALETAGTDTVLSGVLIRKGNATRAHQGRFHLVYESPELVRIYENTTALPEAYIVHRARYASTADDALNLIQSESLDPSCEVVLESKAESTGLQVEPPNHSDSVVVSRPNNNTVMIAVNSRAAGYLVLTDTFYPGWKAYIEGKETPILRANYLFRAISVPAGDYKVRFEYRPYSFLAGAAIFLAMMLAVMAYFAVKLVTGRNRK